MPLLTPEALRQMAAAYERREMKNEKIVEISETSPLDTTGQSEQSLETPVEVMKNLEVESDNPYQSKPKKVCNSRKSERSCNEFAQNSPKPFESTRKSLDDNSIWYSAHDKQPSIDDFKTIVTKNFSFEREQFKQIQEHPEQHLSPAASPQVQISPASPRYDSKSCYQSPLNQGEELTDQNFIQGLGISKCHPNKDTQSNTGDYSPYGDRSELSTRAANYFIDGSITSSRDQKKEDCSLKTPDQMNINVGFPNPQYSAVTLKESIDSRILYRQGDSQIRAAGMSSPGSTFVRSEGSVSPSGSYPVHTISDVLITNSPQDSGISVGSYASPQEWGNGSSGSDAALSPKCMNTASPHGHHSPQQMPFGGSVNLINPSEPSHQINIQPQISPNSLLGTKDLYHQLQQQQHHIYNQQQLLHQQHQQQQQHKQLQLQQQCHQQQQKLKHFHHQPTVSAANIRQNLSISSTPKYDVKVQGHLNQIVQNYGAVTNWQSRTGDIPSHPPDASGKKITLVSF